MLANIIRYMRPGIDLLTQCRIEDNGSGGAIVAWNHPSPQPTQAEIDLAAPLAVAALDVEIAAKAQDGIDRQDLKAAAKAIKTDIQTIIANANAYIANPATNNAQATAQILQLTKDLKTLTQDFAFVSKVVKGLV